MTEDLATGTAAGPPSADIECWCCGGHWSELEVVHLGSHPEVAVCLRCAHFLHQRARDREDAERSSLASHVRDRIRAARRLVMRHGWQHTPVIGPLLRRLGPRLP